MIFAWDPRKDDANWRKHGIRFAQAVAVFDDPDCLFEVDDFTDDEESRWHVVGRVESGSILFVVHTAQGKVEDKIRIISAREATSHEKRAYQSGAL